MVGLAAEFIHFWTIALTVAANAVAVGIGQGIMGQAALEAINIQPASRGDVTKIAVLGIALIETAALMGTFMSVLLILQTKNAIHTPYGSLAELGIVFSICCSGFVLGIVSALPGREACLAIARQPFFAPQITRFVLIVLSLLQTPIIFGLIIALFIRGQAASIITLRDSLRLIASGICIGFGSIGPAIGLALFSQSACRGISVNRDAYRPLFAFTLISQAIIETPIIFALIISIAMLFMVPVFGPENMLDGIMLFAAGLCTGVGTLGPGISSGRTAREACRQISYYPEIYGSLSRMSMFAQGMIETAAVYSVLISFLLLFFR